MKKYKITLLVTAFLIFACEYPEAEQEQLKPKKEADKQTEIPIVYTNEKGIATKQAIFKQLNIKGLYYYYAISEGYFKPTEETAPGEEPIGEYISPFDDNFNDGLPPSFKLKQKGTRGAVTFFFVKKDKFVKIKGKLRFRGYQKKAKSIDCWIVWE